MKEMETTKQLETLLSEYRYFGLTRQSFMKQAAALGVSASAAESMLATGSVAHADGGIVTDIRSIRAVLVGTGRWSLIILVQYLVTLFAAYIDSQILLGLALFSLVIAVLVTVFRSMKETLEPSQALGTGIGLLLLLVVGATIAFVLTFIIGAVDSLAVDVIVLSVAALMVWCLGIDEFLQLLSGLKYTSRYFERNRDSLLEDVRYFDDSIFYNESITNPRFCKQMRADRDIAKFAIRRNTNHYFLASGELRSDPTFVLEILKSWSGIKEPAYSLLELLPDEILSDARIQEFLGEAELWDGGFSEEAVKYIPVEKWNDRNFVLSLIRSNPFVFVELDISLRSDRELLLLAISCVSKEPRGKNLLGWFTHKFEKFTACVAEENLLDDEIFGAFEQIYVAVISEWINEFSDGDEVVNAPRNFGEALSFVEKNKKRLPFPKNITPEKLEVAYRQRKSLRKQ